LKGEELDWEMLKAYKSRTILEGQRILDSSALVSSAQPEHDLSLDGEIDHHLMIFETPDVDVDHDFSN
jgi:hypothetical protein